MDSRLEALRGFLRIGMFIGGCGLLMALIEPRNSPEFVLSLCSALMGGTLVIAVAIAVRRSR